MEKFLYICVNEDRGPYLAVQSEEVVYSKDREYTEIENGAIDEVQINCYHDIEFFLHNLLGATIWLGGDQTLFFHFYDQLIDLYKEFRKMPDMPNTKEKFGKVLENKSHEMFCDITNFFPFY